MSELVLSYNSNDKQIADQLFMLLQRCGVDVWMDSAEHGLGGEEWLAILKEKIRKSRLIKYQNIPRGLNTKIFSPFLLFSL